MDKQPLIKPDPKNLHPADKQHIRLTYVTHFCCNQKNCDMVFDVLRRYEQYDPALLDVVQFVIVDDGSPIDYEIPDFQLNLTWLKITDDIDWNQCGARNLGVVYAKSDKILLTDIDHEFPEMTLRKMLTMRNPGRNIFRFDRRDRKTGQFCGLAGNIFYMSRARFFRFYGYDEEFAGAYGVEDNRFIRLQKYHGSRLRRVNKAFYYYPREDIDRDTSYHSYQRDQTRNRKLDQRKKGEINYWGPESAHSRIALNFHWTILKTLHRNNQLPRRTHRLWKHLWWFR